MPSALGGSASLALDSLIFQGVTAQTGKVQGSDSGTNSSIASFFMGTDLMIGPFGVQFGKLTSFHDRVIIHFQRRDHGAEIKVVTRIYGWVPRCSKSLNQTVSITHSYAKMKFLVVASLALCAAAESKLDVGSIISDYYTSTPSLAPAASTSLASLFNSIETSWTNNPAYTSAQTAIYDAAPTSIQASISASGYNYKDIVTQSWYTKSVDKKIQSAVSVQISAIDSAAAKIVGTPTSSSSKGAGAARQTGLGVAGMVGVVGGVLGAVL